MNILKILRSLPILFNVTYIKGLVDVVKMLSSLSYCFLICVGIGKTVKEKVCVHTSRDIRAIASQLVNVWLEVFRKEKATNGGLKLLRQVSDSSKRKSLNNPASGKPPLRNHHARSDKMENVKGPKLESGSHTEEEASKNHAMSEEEHAALAAVEAARAAARAAAEVCYSLYIFTSLNVVAMVDISLDPLLIADFVVI